MTVTVLRAKDVMENGTWILPAKGFLYMGKTYTEPKILCMSYRMDN